MQMRNFTVKMRLILVIVRNTNIIMRLKSIAQYIFHIICRFANGKCQMFHIARTCLYILRLDVLYVSAEIYTKSFQNTALFIVWSKHNTQYLNTSNMIFANAQFADMINSNPIYSRWWMVLISFCGRYEIGAKGRIGPKGRAGQKCTDELHPPVYQADMPDRVELPIKLWIGWASRD